MIYLLIVLMVALVLSSLMWIRPSPRQKHLAQMRSAALAQGLQVQLSTAPDARPGEGRLDYALYLLPRRNDGPTPPDWLLVKGSRRGDPSPWPEWRWLDKAAPVVYQQPIAEALLRLPEDAVGLVSNRRGVGLYWQERSDLEAVQSIGKTLLALRSGLSG